MNDKYILYKEYLVPFLRKLAKDYRLIAPLANRHGDVLLQEVESVDTARFDFDCQAQGSAKPFLLPQQEVLFSYRISPQGEYVFKEHLDETPTVFFGLRSCDLSAILYMDVIFLRGARDIYYLKRRENSLLISIGCNEPSPNCFCNATGSGPFLDYGFDLQLTDLGDRFFVEPGRIRGEELIRRWRYFFQAAAAGIVWINTSRTAKAAGWMIPGIISTLPLPSKRPSKSRRRSTPFIPRSRRM
ncbi:MAG: hypothetical protein ACQES8_06000 [Thermodesulfobacteriota bacterium]